MKVIFLDIDGVLNTPLTWGKRPHSEALDPPLIKRVSALVKETGAAVVISSTWGKIFPLGAIIGWLAARGFDESGKIFDVTERRANRATEIGAWLVKHPEVTHWCALDDDTAADGSLGHLEYWIPVNELTGVSDANCDKAREYLKD